jgi:hypothetical protein
MAKKKLTKKEKEAVFNAIRPTLKILAPGTKTKKRR